MSYMHRYLRPVVTAVIATTLAVLAWPLRPQPHGYIRPMTEDWYAPVSVQDPGPPIDPTLDTIVFWVWMTGTASMFVGAVLCIWWRSRPIGRHRAPV